MTREQAEKEFDRLGCPGIDSRISQFQGGGDGLRWGQSGGGYQIYYMERGVGNDISFHHSEDEFRKAWKDNYISMYIEWRGEPNP